MRQKITFEAFGITYRTLEFSAAEAASWMGNLEFKTPIDILKLTSVVLYDGTEVVLDEDGINKHVRDCIGHLPPKVVLSGIVNKVTDLNWGFLVDWKAVKIPSRFISGAASVNSEYLPNIISRLIQSESCTLRELEEYYSLRDAFAIFDSLMAKMVNEALANESAQKEAAKVPRR